MIINHYQQSSTIMNHLKTWILRFTSSVLFKVM
jgi:hypothetical protein